MLIAGPTEASLLLLAGQAGLAAALARAAPLVWPAATYCIVMLGASWLVGTQACKQSDYVVLCILHSQS